MARAVEDRRDSAGDVAILYRTNAQSRPFEEELVRRRIPYVVVGGMKFYERAEVKDALAYLRLAGRPEDDLAFRRVVNVPSRGIGQATLERIAKAARDAGKSWWEISANPPAELTDRARTALSRFRAIVSELAERAQSEPPSALLEHLLQATGYAALYDRSEDSEDVAAPREPGRARQLGAGIRTKKRRGRDARRVPGFRLAGDGCRCRGRRSRSDPLDASRREGSRVPDGVRRRARGGLSPARPVRGGRGRAGGGAPTALRRHDAGEGRAHSDARAPPAGLRAGPAADGVAIRGGDPGGVGRGADVRLESPDGVYALRRRGRVAGSGPARNRGAEARPPRPPPAYGYGVILAQEGSGDETRLTVYFDRAGKKKFVARYADLTPA